MRAGTLVACDTARPQNGIAFDDLTTWSPGAVAVQDGRIVSAGAAPAVERIAAYIADLKVVDFSDCVVMPGFVDAHSHPLFAGNREPDFVARQHGQAPPLGMLYTV